MPADPGMVPAARRGAPWRRDAGGHARARAPPPRLTRPRRSPSGQRPGCRRTGNRGLGRQGEPELRRSTVAQRVHDGAPQNLVHEPLIEKPHFGLRRMHVDVHAIGRQLDEQMHFGAALLDRGDAVGLLDRVRDRAVAHHPAIDEHVLRAAHGPLLAERGDIAAHRDMPAASFATATRSARSP